MASYRKLPSGKWQATVRTPTGRRTRTDQYKAVVRTWAEEEEARVRRGQWTDPHDGRATVGEWWARWVAARHVELATERREESHWRVHIEPRWGSVQLAHVTAWDVETWATSMSKAGVGATTRGQVLRLLRMLMAEATRHRLIPADPTAGVKIPTPPKRVDRILTRSEWDVLDDASGQDPFIRTLLFAGARWAEAAGLHAHRVTLLPPADDGQVRSQLRVAETVRRDGTIKPEPKSEAGKRPVPIVPRLQESLAPLVAAASAGPCTCCDPALPAGLLFPAPDGGPLDYSNWRRRVWVPTLRKARLADPQPTPHQLRHTFGTWLAEGRVPPHEIAALMGHSTLRATERYLHAGDGRYGRAVAALL